MGGGAEEGVGAAAALGGVVGELHALAQGLAQGFGRLAAELLGPDLAPERPEGFNQLDLSLDVRLGEPVREIDEVETERRGDGGKVGRGVEEGGQEEAILVRYRSGGMRPAQVLPLPRMHRGGRRVRGRGVRNWKG
ncbi:MAG: hypothetical protein IPJ41_15230 [Phycisphaerales bacterium]|nr:hypothetical protein [Phycisphaerales bacterium]